MENSGVLLPMLKHLGVELELVRNHVSIGIEDRVIRVESEASVADYQALLEELYPQSKVEITRIIEQIRLIMKYMKVQYGINNPIFLDMKQDRDYLMKEDPAMDGEVRPDLAEDHSLEPAGGGFLAPIHPQPEPAGHHLAAFLPTNTSFLRPELYQAVPGLQLSAGRDGKARREND